MFDDREHAGRELAEALTKALKAEPGEAQAELVVLGLPRGGVPVAAEVARELGAPLDVLLVRKLGHPYQPELAMAALAEGGFLVRNEDVVLGVPEHEFSAVLGREEEELARRAAAYRGDRPALELTGKRAVLVDDGLATGATMRAAIAAAHGAGAAAVVVAVPVAAPGSHSLVTRPVPYEDLSTPERARRTARGADQYVCLSEPAYFSAVGQWYRRFDQTTDGEVKRLLAAARQGP